VAFDKFAIYEKSFFFFKPKKAFRFQVIPGNVSECINVRND